MATNEECFVDGTPVSDLRVVDLKEQLEKRGLSKSGSKTVLVKRLKDHLALEKLQAEQMGKDPDTAPNMEMKTCGSDLVSEYLEQQQQMLQAARMASARTSAASPLDTSSSPSAAESENRLASPKTKRTKSPRKSEVEQESSAGPMEQAASTPAVDELEIPTSNQPLADLEATVKSPSTEKMTEITETASETENKQEIAQDAEKKDETETTTMVEEAFSQPMETTAEIVKSPQQPPADQETGDTTIYATPATISASTPYSTPAENLESIVSNLQPTLEKTPIAGEVEGDGEDDGGDVRMKKDEEDGVDGGVEMEADVEKTATKLKFPIEEPDDVEMEISAPSNAVDEILEAANTAPAEAASVGKKETRESQEPAEEEKINLDIPQRKRKWVAATRTKRTPISISSDSLKDIVGSVSGAMKEEVVEEAEPAAPPPKRIVIARDVSTDDAAPEEKTDVKADRRVEIETARLGTKVTEDGYVRQQSPSPPRHPPSNIVHVRGLTRPFTLPALHDLLSKHGTFSKADFWIDSIKSHCIVKYATEEQAVMARERLHNIQWPSTDAKILRVDFATQEDLDRHRERDGQVTRGNRTSRAREVVEKTEQQESRKVERERDRERRSSSPAPGRRARDRSWDRGKTWRSGESPPTDPRGASGHKVEGRSPERRATEAKSDQPPQSGKLLDELFRKTKATPCIYWLPLSEEQIREKDRERRKREQDRQERIRKLEDSEWDRRRYGGRRSPFDYRGRRR